MIIDIAKVLSGEIDSLDINYNIEGEELDFLSGNLSGAKATTPVSVVGKIRNAGGYISLTLTAGFDYVGECARCLDEVKGHFESDFERPVAAVGTLQDEDDEDYVLSDAGKINIDLEICEDLALSFPIRLLCSEDCEGLCPKCGKPKKDGPCGCETKEIDPRLKILAQLLEK